METSRRVSCGNNSPVIGFIWRWSLYPLVPFVYIDVDSIFHCLLPSPWKWTIIFRKLISATHGTEHQRYERKATQSSTPFICVTLHTHSELISVCEDTSRSWRNLKTYDSFYVCMPLIPHDPLFAMLWMCSLCLNFRRFEWYWLRKGLEAAAAIVIRW